MNQVEILGVLVAKLQAGSITRRQMVQAAAFFGISAVALTEAAGAAPASQSAQLRPRSQADGEVRFLIAEAFWADWHQYLSTAQSQWRIGRQIFDTLVQIETDDFSNVTPGLAESWTQIDDVTWEFKLRQGVKFHQGQPFTGEDVKASIELATGVVSEETSTASRWVPTTVEIVDDVTVHLVTSAPFAPMLNELSRLPILSAADIQPADDPATPSAGLDTLKAFPNGTGPFKLANDEQNVKTLEANADYWGGAPAIQTLVWEYIQDGQTRLNAFLGNQAQAIDRVPPEHLPMIQASDAMAFTSVTGFENVNLWTRMDAAAPWDAGNARLRQAVAMAINREEIVSSLVSGASEVSVTHIPNHAVYAAPQQPAYAYDPDGAKAILAELGYAEAGPDMPIWGVTGFLPRGKEVAEAIADNLKQVGFNVQLQVTDIAGMIDGLFSEDKQGIFFHISWSSNGDPHGALATLYTSPGAWVGINDPIVDDLISQGFSTIDSDARQQVYSDLQAYLWDNMIHIPLYNSDFTIGHVAKLTGLVVLPNFDTIFKSAVLES